MITKNRWRGRWPKPQNWTQNWSFRPKHSDEMVNIQLLLIQLKRQIIELSK